MHKPEFTCFLYLQWNLFVACTSEWSQSPEPHVAVSPPPHPSLCMGLNLHMFPRPSARPRCCLYIWVVSINRATCGSFPSPTHHCVWAWTYVFPKPSARPLCCLYLSGLHQQSHVAVSPPLSITVYGPELTCFLDLVPDLFAACTSELSPSVEPHEGVSPLPGTQPGYSRGQTGARWWFPILSPSLFYHIAGTYPSLHPGTGQCHTCWMGLAK